MTYVLGAKSLTNLTGVHPLLLDVVKRAIAISTQDFGVTEPQVRTLEYQKKLVARGVSKTLKSNHIQHPDFTGKSKTLYGHAVDLVPWVGGKFTWEWQYIWPIASAMAQAAHDAGHRICWGGAWDQWLVPGSPAAMQTREEAYCSRHPGKDFVDGPHFQIGVIG